jgi:hypothetical protein
MELRGKFYYILNNKEYLLIGVELKDDRQVMKVKNNEGKYEWYLLDYFQIKFKRSR